MLKIFENSLTSILVVLVLLKINKHKAFAEGDSEQKMISSENELCNRNLSLAFKNEHSKIMGHDKVAIVILIII